MEIQTGIAKIDRFSSQEEGDKVELIERPKGGLSIILAEGKLSGHRSRALTLKVVHNLLTLISEGIHDGAASRAVLNAIMDEHGGKAEVGLSLISCDLETQTIVITKNNFNPVVIIRQDQIDFLPLSEESKDCIINDPSVYQFQMEKDLTFVVISDGVFMAGQQNEQQLDLRTSIDSMLEDNLPTVQEMADLLLNQAIQLDAGRPKDDMTVIVFRIAANSTEDIRRISVQYPI